METSGDAFFTCYKTEALAKLTKLKYVLFFTMVSAILSPLVHCSSPLVKSLRQSDWRKKEEPSPDY